MMQWVPYGQSLDEFLAHVRTFREVFPNVRVIAGPGGYGFYMLGSDGPVDLDPATMSRGPLAAGHPRGRERAPPTRRRARSTSGWDRSSA